jgi:hypothetical protein
MSDFPSHILPCGTCKNFSRDEKTVNRAVKSAKMDEKKGLTVLNLTERVGFCTAYRFLVAPDDAALGCRGGYETSNLFN